MSFSTHPIVAASSAVNAPTQPISVSTSGTSANSGCARATMYTPAVTIVAAWISAETGGGASIRAGPLQRGGEPDVERDPGRLPARAEVDEEHDRAQRRDRERVRLRLREERLELERPRGGPQHDDPDDEAEVADLRDPERLHRGARRRGGLGPVPDEQVGAEPDQLPEHEHLKEARREHEAEHREGEQRLVGVVAAERRRRLLAEGGGRGDPPAGGEQEPRERQREHERRESGGRGQAGRTGGRGGRPRPSGARGR